MTPSERKLWELIQRRASRMDPTLASAMLRSFQAIRRLYSDAELARIIAVDGGAGLVSQLYTDAVLNRAFQPVRDTLRAGLHDGVKAFAPQVMAIVPPATRRTVTIAFDYLNPRVIDAVRSLETRVMTTLSASVRDTVRAYVENGLRDGVGPTEIARDLRAIIGLAPNQARAVESFRAALEGGPRSAVFSAAFDRALRDKRFDTQLAKAMLNGEKLTAAQVDRMTDRYRARMLAFNAETNARTAALDAQKLAQRLSWEDAIDKGVLERDRLMKTWVGTMDDRERPEHVAMEGQTVGFDEAFSNGQVIPGDGEFNCRCVPRYFVARA